MRKLITTIVAALVLPVAAQAQMTFVEDITQLLHGEVVYTEEAKDHIIVEVELPNYVELKHVIAGTSVALSDMNGKVYKDWKVEGASYVTFVYFYIGDVMHLIQVKLKDNILSFTFKNQDNE